MSKKISNNLLAALDVGTNKVVALICDAQNGDQIEIIGVGSQPSRGLKQGMVVNIDATVQAILRAIQEAELMAGCQVNSVYTGIAGSHIRSLNSQGIVPIRNREVTQHDVDRVIDAAKAVAIPTDQKILHILPQEFIIDSQMGIKEPVGMSGVRLEAKVHIVTGSVSATQNIVKCIEKCNLRAANIILQPLASSHAVLSDDEKELGVCLVDIGGGTTDVAVFTNGAIRHSAVIPIAGDQVTNDVAIAFRIPTKYSEKIKIEHGCAWSPLVSTDDLIPVPAIANQQAREITKKTLAEVIEARYEELFFLVKQELKQYGFLNSLASGIVLTGGASKMFGVMNLAEQIFQVPVRLGAPHDVGGNSEVLNNPIFATGVGLLMLGLQHQQEGRPEMGFGEGMKSMWERMRGWFQGSF
ncbi:MAG: cell division protein FtsA [Gammaproteobacteria bacterium]